MIFSVPPLLPPIPFIRLRSTLQAWPLHRRQFRGLLCTAIVAVMALCYGIVSDGENVLIVPHAVMMMMFTIL